MKYLSLILLGWLLITPVVQEGEEEEEAPPEEEVARVKVNALIPVKKVFSF